jgi:hypothetical protein
VSAQVMDDGDLLVDVGGEVALADNGLDGCVGG